MMYLYRYRNGEHKNVWAELCNLPQRNVGMVEIAKEFVDRALRNFHRLKTAYEDIGYKFDVPNEVILPPEENIETLLKDFEEKYKCELPILFKEWHRRIGQVNFSQDASQESSGPLAHLGTYHSFTLVHFSESVRHLEVQLEFLESSGCPEENRGLQLRAGGPVASNCDPYGIDLKRSGLFDGEFALDEFGSLTHESEMITMGETFRRLFPFGGLGYRQIAVYHGIHRPELFGWEEFPEIDKYIAHFQSCVEPL
jgi:hypothetical protein